MFDNLVLSVKTCYRFRESYPIRPAAAKILLVPLQAWRHQYVNKALSDSSIRVDFARLPPRRQYYATMHRDFDIAMVPPYFFWHQPDYITMSATMSFDMLRALRRLKEDIDIRNPNISWRYAKRWFDMSMLSFYIRNKQMTWQIMVDNPDVKWDPSYAVTSVVSHDNQLDYPDLAGTNTISCHTRAMSQAIGRLKQEFALKLAKYPIPDSFYK